MKQKYATAYFYPTPEVKNWAKKEAKKQGLSFSKYVVKLVEEDKKKNV